MALKARRSHLSVSLFPFLSILCCVIGTLTLILAGLLACANGAPPSEPPAPPPTPEPDPAEEYVRLTAERDSALEERRTAQARISELESLVLQATSLAEKLAAAKEELARLMAEHRSAEDARLAEAEAAAKRKIDFLAALDDLRKRILVLERELKKVQDEIETITRRSSSPPPSDAYILAPAGSKTDLTPRFIECVSDGLSLDAEKARSQQRHISKVSISKDAAFRALLGEVKRDPRGTAIFLVREGGVPAFDAARAVARELDARHGFLPVPGSKPIDFSLISNPQRR